MNKMVSIIVPIYNASLYLEQCLNSIYEICYDNFEVILIDDYSTDNSVDICKKYTNNKKFKLITKNKNSGVSSSRNIGIKESKGYWIYFMDSDDLCEKAIFDLLSNVEDDLVIFGYEKKFKNKSIQYLNNKEISSNLEDEIIKNENIGGYLWNKIYKSSIIKENHLLFDESIHFCEDMLFNINYLKYVHNFKYDNNVMYTYRMRKNSATLNFYNKRNISILKALENVETNVVNEDNKNYLKYRYLKYYYKLKPLITNDVDINKNYLSNEKNIKNKNRLNIKEKALFFLTKHINNFSRLLEKIKNKKNKLYD